jgi:hypothetical protein
VGGPSGNWWPYPEKLLRRWKKRIVIKMERGSEEKEEKIMDHRGSCRGSLNLKNEKTSVQ